LSSKIVADREQLRDITLDVEALRATDYFSSLHEARSKELATKQAEFQGLVARQTELSETRLALSDYLERVDAGDYGSPTAHLTHPHHPTAPPVNQRRAIEIWAAVSGALALMVFGYLIVTTPPHWVGWSVAMAIGFGAIDALARGRLARFLLTSIIALAIITTIILFIEFWQWIIVAGLALVVLYMIRDNLREVV
jgi:hypothetical protein